METSFVNMILKIIFNSITRLYVEEKPAGCQVIFEI